MVKARLIVLLLFTVTAAILLLETKPILLNDEPSKWIEKNLDTKTPSASLESFYQITVNTPELNNTVLQQLQNYEHMLNSNNEIVRECSIFTVPVGIVKKGDGEDSSWLTLQKLADYKGQELYKVINLNRNSFSPFLGNDNKKVIFYIATGSNHKLNMPATELKVDVLQPFSSEKNTINWILLIIFLFFISAILRFIFESWIAPLIIFSSTLILSIITISLYSLLWDIQYSVLSICLIAIAIGYGNLLIFYYRWHVHQRHLSSSESLKYTFGRTIIPMFTNTILLAILTFSIILLDIFPVMTPLLKLIALTQIVTFVLLMTFLPALLSYITINKPKLLSLKWFEKFEHTLHQFGTTLFVLFMILFALSFGLLLKVVLPNHPQSHTISVGLKYQTIDLQIIQKIANLETKLKHTEGITDVVSVVDYIRYIDPQPNKKQYDYSQSNLSGALFYLDLFGLKETYFKQTYPILQIYLAENANHQSIIKTLQRISSEKELIFFDTVSDIDEKQISTFYNSAIIGFILLVFISIIPTYWTSQKALWLHLGFINLLPIGLFYSSILILQIPIGIESIISVLIATALVSDTALYIYYNHFADVKKYDTFIAERIEDFYTISATLLTRILVILILLALAFSIDGTGKMTAIYMAFVIILSTLTEWFMIPKLSKKLN
jgi:hypothetical protein